MVSQRHVRSFRTIFMFVTLIPLIGNLLLSTSKLEYLNSHHHEESSGPIIVTSNIHPGDSSDPTTRTSLITHNANTGNNDDPMFRCRLQLQGWLQPQIADWIRQEVPILDWVSTNHLPNNGILQIQFLSEHLKWSNNQTAKSLNLSKLNWYCGTRTYQELATVHVVRKSHLFFLLCNQTPSLEQHSDDESLKVWTDELYPFNYSYQLQPFVDCDAMEQKYGRPPAPPRQSSSSAPARRNIQLAMCSVLYGDDLPAILTKFAENYAYHKRLGVQHFWVFINMDLPMSPPHDRLPQVEDVTYIPYNFRWKDFHKYANFEPPFQGASMWQEAMQNQCLSRLRRYNVEWVLTIDVDEFVDVRSTTGEQYPLRSFLAQHPQYDDPTKRTKKSNKKKNDEKPIGAWRLMSVPFPTNRQFDRPEMRPYRMTMDHVHRWDDNLGTFIDFTRPKLIYRATLCDIAGVHWCRRYNHGAISKSLNATYEMLLRHIRAAHQDEYWLGGKVGGRGILKDSKMAQDYRIPVCHDMIHGPFAAFVTHLDEAKCNDWPPNSGNNHTLA